MRQPDAEAIQMQNRAGREVANEESLTDLESLLASSEGGESVSMG